MSKYDDSYDDDVEADDLLPASERKAEAPPLPKGTHIEPAESEVPPPHIPSAPAQQQPSKHSGAGGSMAENAPEGSALSPHFPPASTPDSTLTRAKPNRGDFGAGIF